MHILIVQITQEKDASRILAIMTLWCQFNSDHLRFQVHLGRQMVLLKKTPLPQSDGSARSWQGLAGQPLRYSTIKWPKNHEVWRSKRGKSGSYFCPLMCLPKGIILLSIVDFLLTDVINVSSTITKMSLGSKWLSVLPPHIWNMSHIGLWPPSCF